MYLEFVNSCDLIFKLECYDKRISDSYSENIVHKSIHFDLLTHHKLLHHYKIKDYLSKTSLFHLDWNDFWAYNGAHITWLSWIVTNKNNIDLSYLLNTYKTYKVDLNEKTFPTLKYLVKNQVKQLKTEILESNQSLHFNQEVSESAYCQENSNGSVNVFCKNLEVSKKELSPDNLLQSLWTKHLTVNHYNCWILYNEYCIQLTCLFHKLCLFSNICGSNVCSSKLKTDIIKKNLLKLVNKLIVEVSNTFKNYIKNLIICQEPINMEKLNKKQTTQVLKVLKNKNQDKLKKKNKLKSKSLVENALPTYLQDYPQIKKYWVNRYRLFSKFDRGIKLDYESWFSVTPEKIAKHTAERCKCDIIIDAFCGAGGNSIAFAKTCKKVISIDIDPLKIEMARHNAKIYGVENKIEFIVGDFFNLSEKLTADVVFLSPPWGGPSYTVDRVFDLNNILAPQGGGIKLFKMSQKISKNIAYFLPRNIEHLQLAEIAGLGSKVEIEKNMIQKRVIAITAYYGNLLKNPTKKK